MTIKLNLLNNADFKNLIKVVDKLEQRISTLEKKLEPKPKQLEFNFNQVELNN